MNTILGKVVLKETGLGVPDLLVVIFDIDPNTQPEEARASGVTIAVPSVIPQADRLGSVLTERNPAQPERNGSFSLTYEDEEFRIRNADEKRPDLLLMVFAPEEPGQDPSAQILFTSPVLRQNAGRTESYLIRIPAKKLEEAGISVPIASSLMAEEPNAVIHNMTQVVTQRSIIEKEVQKIAGKQVAAARQKSQKIEAEIESRFIEKLTGVPAQLAERLNFVPPGGDVEKVAYNTLNKSIEKDFNTRPAVAGYIVIPDADVERFKDANGNLRNDIAPGEIEPYIFGSADDSERPMSLVREDPVALLCETLSANPDPLGDASGDGGTHTNGHTQPGDTDGGGSGNGSNGHATAEDISRYIGNLMNRLTPPEDLIALGSNKRPTNDDVHNDIQDFTLHTGPADVPALYDFHNLQIAFDYVWQQAIDEGVIQTGSELSRQLMDMGGDPLGAMQNGHDPVKVLRSELNNVQVAHAGLNASGISFRHPGVIYMRKNDPDGIPDPAPGPHPRPGRPDIVAPFPEVAVLEPRRPRQPHELLDLLEELLGQRYKFETYAPGSVNFGLLVTYRQMWKLQNHQVGDLVKTITLSPKETRKVSSKRTVRKERSVKEMENNLRVRKDESSDTMRDEAEIVRKAVGKTNFTLTADGSYNIGISKGDSKSTFGKDAETTSQEVKKSFREAVMKAALEYRDEHNITVDTKDSFDQEVTESAEISNPNDELTVTYLFYELQRRFKISEHIHRLTPVVLVGMEVPNPGRKAVDQILLTHSWIINRVLLDDRYRAPLDYLCTRIVGDELALREMYQTVTKLREIVDEMKKKLAVIVGQVEVRNSTLEKALEKRAALVASESTEGMGEKVWEWAVGSGDDEAIEAARLREEGAREAYDKAVRERDALLDELRSESAALNAATGTYAKAYAEHSNHLLEIAGLRVHFKENMLFYMQAIWSFTFQDQIFFMLHKLKAPKLSSTVKTYSVAPAAVVPASIVVKPGHTVLEVHATVKLKSGLDPAEDFVTLAEIADLDSPLGYKGNYMIFPLKKSNALTDFMMMPYVDSELGLHDPDELGNWTPEDFTKYVACLKANLPAGEFDEVKDQLREQYMRILSAPRRAKDEVVVPTGSLFIEALPGAHPILEDFKLLHRVVDVKKVHAEVRKLEMENIRYAARILSGEREDPEIEKKIMVEGVDETIVNPET